MRKWKHWKGSNLPKLVGELGFELSFMFLTKHNIDKEAGQQDWGQTVRSQGHEAL